MSEGLGKYTRSPERGFRKFAMAFWDAPREGLIYGHVKVDVSRMRQFQEHVQQKFGIRPSIGLLVGRSVALALHQVPEGNAKIIWGQAYLKDTVDVYYQVDVEDGKDLSGVVVPDVGRKTCVEVTQILNERAGKLRRGEDEQYEKTQKGLLSYVPGWLLRFLLKALTFLEYNFGIPPTFLGANAEPFGTVMVTNVSKFGIDVAYAPLVPVSRVPLIVLVGQPTDEAWVRDGKLVVAPVAPFSATFDHRLLDGNKIGRIVRAVRSYLEDPFRFEAEALGLEVPPPPWELPALPDGGAAASAAETATPAPDAAAEAGA
ncbi:MAG: 2-oxo acid dehydrogenase subunit E2 [Planctomycetota bacterium]